MERYLAATGPFRVGTVAAKASAAIPPERQSDRCSSARITTLVAMTNGLTLELTYNEGSTYGVWLFGERFLWWVVAGNA